MHGPMKKTVIMEINQTIKKIEESAKLKVIGIRKIINQRQLQSPSTALNDSLIDSKIKIKTLYSCMWI